MANIWKPLRYSSVNNLLAVDEDREIILPPKLIIPANFKPIVMNDVYYDELDCNDTYQLWYGGGNSAKSYEIARKYLYRSMTESYFRLLFTRKTAIEVRDSCFLLFKDIIRDHGWGKLFKILESSMDILCIKTGNLLLSGGLDDVDKLKSIADITDVWVEEAITRNPKSAITYDDFIQLDLRLRTKKVKYPKFQMTFNPITKNSWIYTYFFEKEIYTPVRKLKTTYRDNAFTSQKAIDSLKRLEGVRNDDYLVYDQGEWATQKSGSEWLFNFQTAIHTDHVPFIARRDVGLSFDFNIMPYQTMLCFQLHRDKEGVLWIRFFKEYTLSVPYNTPEDCVRSFIEMYPQQYGHVPVRVYGDASGKWSVDDYRGIFSEASQYTATDKDQVNSVNANLTDARDLLNDILAEKYDDIRITIDRTNCPKLILDCETLQEAPTGFDPEYIKVGEKKIESKGHCYSAMSYVIQRLFPHLLRSNVKY